MPERGEYLGAFALVENRSTGTFQLADCFIAVYGD
jgi:hypothetical protein